MDVAQQLFDNRHDTKKLLLFHHPDKPNGTSENFITIRSAIELLESKSKTWYKDVHNVCDIQAILASSTPSNNLFERFYMNQAPNPRKKPRKDRGRYLTFGMVYSTIYAEMGCQHKESFKDARFIRSGNVDKLILRWAKDLVWHKICKSTNLLFDGLAYETSNGDLVPIEYDWMLVLLQHLDAISNFGVVERCVSNWLSLPCTIK